MHKVLKYISLYIIFLIAASQFICLSLFAQTNKNPKYFLSPEIAFQGQPRAGLYMFIAHTEEKYALGMVGWKLGAETNFNPQKIVFAARAGYEVNFIMGAGRLSMITYFDEAFIDYRLLPEFGITALGLFSLTYGYAIPLAPFRTDAVSSHKVGLSANLYKKWWKEAFFK